jgi:LPXTG-motif cell wall-anchored protein
MLRKEMRRRLRRREVRTRLVAGVTAIAIGLGLAVGGTAVATANPNATLSTPVVNSGGVVTYNQNGLACSSSLINFQKPDALDSPNIDTDGTYTAAWGSISWEASERTVTWSITPGWDVDVCVKGGTHLSTIDTSAASGTSYTHTYAGLSHLGFRINAASPTNDLTCTVATNYTGRALTNGDHINMDIVQNGAKFQVNAQVDIRQAQDPVSPSGLVVRVNAPGGPYTLPLTTAQRDSGVLAFAYSTYLSSSFTVEWVQFNSTYFNQNRDETRFLVCGDLTTEELVTPSARMIDLTCDAAGSYTLDAVEGIRWFIGSTEVQPGTYTVSTASTAVVRAEAIAPDYGLEPDAQSEFTFVFTEPGPCADPTFDGRTVTAAECDNDTPWIDFTVVVNDPDGQLTNRTATLTFVHPTDPAQNHVVELGDLGTGNVLEGRILWPGASVDPVTGEPTGWPGWAFADGQWVETTGNFAWTRSLTEVTLTVNPEMQIAIAYPPATPECVAGPVELEPIAVKETCLTDGQAAFDLPAITGVTWFVNGQQRDAGTYPVLAAQTVEITFAIDPAALGGPYALKPGAAESFTFDFTAGDLCDLPELPVTNASIAFLEPTCDLGQQLDPANFVVEDAELARYAPELSDLEGPSYAVVFVITDEDAVFFDSSEPVPGRTVSNGGKTLTFTGTLLGPDRSEECVTVVELRDPVSYVDTCFEQSVTITRVVGIVYTVSINDETPYVVEWVGDETTRTILVDEGDSVRVIPSPASDRYTISPEPAPFERTFEVYPFECLETSPLTTASAAFTPATCDDMTNWVTLEEADGVQWWVNGERAQPGTWPMSTGETVVQATPLPGFGFPAEQPTRWEFDGVDPSAECLELASTGVSQSALTAGIAGLVMLLLGAGILGYRRQRA